MGPRNATAVAVPLEENSSETIALPEQGVSDRMQALKIIQEDLGNCTRCVLHQQRKKIVFGDGDPKSRLMFVGEGPGEEEDETGKPFVGHAGKVLEKMFNDLGIKREKVYIANIVMCRPPGNRKPKREECQQCRPFLRRQIEAIKPKIIVALGATAAKRLLATTSHITELRRREFHDYPPAGVRRNDPNWEGCKVKVTYHPASRRGKWQPKGEAWKDLQMVIKELGIKRPKVGT